MARPEHLEMSMRRNRTFPTLPNLLPRRLRLVKLLRAHGLRDAERLREDELLGALSRLKIVMPSAAPIPFHAPLPTSSAGASDGNTGGGESHDDDDDDRYDDPHALPRFREPKIFIPAGERTFLRLIAVDPQTLFATWDLDAAARDAICGPMVLELVRLDVEEQGPRPRVAIDLSPGGWYLEAPESGATMLARLITVGDAGDVVLAESNATIVLPNRPQEGGEVVFATIPFATDRRQLAGGKLLEKTKALPHDVTVDFTGQSAHLPPSEFSELQAQMQRPSKFEALSSSAGAKREGDLPSSQSGTRSGGALR